jgi:hypothetical protein
MRVKFHDNHKLLLLLGIPIAIEFGLGWSFYLLFWKA